MSKLQSIKAKLRHVDPALRTYVLGLEGDKKLYRDEINRLSRELDRATEKERVARRMNDTLFQVISDVEAAIGGTHMV